jgi:methionyl-tRNA synthetase
LQIAANCAIALAPFLPTSSTKLSGILGLDQLNWNGLGSLSIVKPKTQLGEVEHLFQKIEDDIIVKQKEKLESKSLSNTSETSIEPFKEDIVFDDFLKLDLRVGTILSAESIPKSKKLLKFSVDLGSETRTILSGIAKHYSPKEMVGKQVQVIANLPPRKMMGIESQGMILMAEDESGELSLMQPDKEITNGATIN